jgi:hypothetical protein
MNAMSESGGYYKCLRGDSEHLAMFEPDAFAVLDARGRNWICYRIAQRQVEDLSMVAHVADVFEADAAASRHGLNEGGTEVRIYFCEDAAELHEKLAASGG